MRLVITCVFALWSALALAEEVVTIPTPGGDMVGTLALPEGEPAPVVILMHGFASTRDELTSDHVPEGVFARTAEQLEDFGYASLRFDFRGSGESVADLTFADTTFESQVADGLAAIDYLTALETVRADAIYLIGWSQGGLVAAAVAGRSGLPDAVALWNAVSDPVATFGGLIGAEKIAMAAKGAADAVHKIELPWGAEVSLKGAFFQDVMTIDPPAELTPFGGPLLIVQGELDTTVSPESAQDWIEAHTGDEELWTAEMDHVFNIFGEADTLDAVIAKTIEYFDLHHQ